MSVLEIGVSSSLTSQLVVETRLIATTQDTQVWLGATSGTLLGERRRDAGLVGRSQHHRHVGGAGTPAQEALAGGLSVGCARSRARAGCVGEGGGGPGGATGGSGGWASRRRGTPRARDGAIFGLRTTLDEGAVKVAVLGTGMRLHPRSMMLFNVNGVSVDWLHGDGVFGASVDVTVLCREGPLVMLAVSVEPLRWEGRLQGLMTMQPRAECEGVGCDTARKTPTPASGEASGMQCWTCKHAGHRSSQCPSRSSGPVTEASGVGLDGAGDAHGEPGSGWTPTPLGEQGFTSTPHRGNPEAHGCG